LISFSSRAPLFHSTTPTHGLPLEWSLISLLSSSQKYTRSGVPPIKCKEDEDDEDDDEDDDEEDEAEDDDDADGQVNSAMRGCSARKILVCNNIAKSRTRR
jgi:hypothetical protein